MRRVLLLTCLTLLGATASCASAFALAAPKLASPADGAHVQQLPAIVWNAVRGAAGYEYQISAESHFNSIALGRGVGKGVSQTHNLAAALDKTVADGTYYWRVRALSAHNGTGPWSRARKITKRWTIAPQITGGDLAEVSWPRTPLELSWTPVPYANKYIVSVATDPALSNLVLGTAAKPSETQGIHLVMPISLAPGPYYWAITPVDAEGRRGARSALASFQWTWPTATASMSITDLAPQSGIFNDPILSWAPVAGAARYEVEINADKEWAPGSRWCCAGTTTGTSLAPLQTLANNAYYWRVRAIDARGDAGMWNVWNGNELPPLRDEAGHTSFTKSFDPTVPSIPGLTLETTDGGELTGLPETSTPIVSWSPVPGASVYQVQVAPYRPLGPEPPYTPECEWSIVSHEPSRYQAETATTAWTPLGSASATSDHIGPPAWPHAQDSAPLRAEVAFTATMHAGQSTLTATALSNEDVGDLVRGEGIPAGAIVVEVKGGAVKLSAAATATAEKVELTATPRYCLRVAARTDNDAQHGQVISEWRQINGPRQPAFIYTSRPAGARAEPFLTPAGSYLLPEPKPVAKRTPLFTWKPLSGARGYYVVIARDSAFTEVADVGFTNVPAYAPRLAVASQTPLSDETTSYYWAVIPAANADGSGVGDDVAQDNSPQSFNKSSDPPSGLLPMTGAEVSTQPTFQWTGADNARSYTLQVAQDPTFGTLIDNVTTDATAFTSSSTYPADTLLFWRVRANDWIGQGLNWSNTYTFVRKLPAPALYPRGETTIFGPEPVTWSSVNGAVAYEMQTEQGDGKVESFTSESPAISATEYYGTGIVRYKVRAEFPTSSGTKVGGAYSAQGSSVLILAAPTGASGTRSGSRLLVTWHSEPDAKQYEVEISTTSGFGTVIEVHRVDGTSWAPDVDLTRRQYRGALYWRVAPVDQRGGIGSFTSGSFGAARSRGARCVTRHAKHGRHTACKKH